MFKIKGLSKKSGKEKILKDFKSEQELIIMGYPHRIYDYITGLSMGVVIDSYEEGNETFRFKEPSLADIKGILLREYGLYGIYGYMKVTNYIWDKIDNMRELTADDINTIVQNGFLQFLFQRDSKFSSIPRVGTLLRAEQILMQFEKDGKIGYNEVLQGITDSLEQDDLSDEDRKVLEYLKTVYENDMFKAQREGDEVIQEEQNKANIASPQATEKKHIPTDGARAILEYMKKHNLTTQDLSLALAMAQATKTGVREAESHIVNTQTRQNIPDRGEST